MLTYHSVVSRLVRSNNTVLHPTEIWVINAYLDAAQLTERRQVPANRMLMMDTPPISFCSASFFW